MSITKEQKIALKTMAIKASVYNFIRKSLYKKGWLLNFSEADKKAFLEELTIRNASAHKQLNDFKKDRKKKVKVQKEREERGYKPKIKTSKTEWEKIKNFGNYPDGTPFPKDPSMMQRILAD